MESKYRFVRINSKNRTLGGRPSNFTVNLSQDQTTHRVIEVHIMSASVIHDFYNIRTSINDVLVITGSIGGTQSITVPEGFYTTTQLLAEIKTQFDALFNPSTITFNQSVTTNKISYTVVGENVSFESLNDNNLSTLAPNLGITTTTISNLTGTFESTPRLQGIEHVYVQSGRLNNSGNIRSQEGTFDNTFLSMPVNAPYGSLITYQAQASHQEQIVYNAPRDLSLLDIRLTDDDGNELDLSDNHEFVLVLKFFYI